VNSNKLYCLVTEAQRCD